ncbi:MAG: hypothetical protein WBG46_00810 [Nonlabens sp.]
MKKHLYLYLFIFASLIALVLYINGRKYQEQLEKQVSELRSKVQSKDSEIDDLEVSSNTNSSSNSFSLDQNPEAEDYFYSMNLTVDKVKQRVTDRLLELNLEDGGNPLIPYVGADRGFQISNILFVNHKWVMVNFYDGDQWGDALIQYNFDETNELELETIKSLIYLN